MPIATSDLLLKLSTTSGSAGNTTAGTPNGSLGKYISTTQVTDNTLNNLFDDVTGDENAQGTAFSDYRCVFIHNNHASITLENPVVWITAQQSGGANAFIAVDTTAASAVGSSTAQALTIATETTAPSGLTFSTPSTKATGLSLGNIAPGFVKAIWIQRQAQNNAAINNDSVTFRIEGDTQA